MADDVLFMESFDDNLHIERVQVAAANVSVSYGLNGKGARLGDLNGASVQLSNTNPFLVGFNFQTVTLGGSNAILFTGNSYEDLIIYDAAQQRIGVLHYYGSVYTPPGSVKLGKWHYIEVLVYANTGSAGYAKIWVDGTLQASGTGLDWYQTATGGDIIGGGDAGIMDAFNIDDLYVMNNVSVSSVPLGPVAMKVLLPNGNGNSSGLLGSDGNSVDNYLLVDNNAAAPPATTEYVGGGTEGDKDTYVIEDLVGTPIVKAVDVSLLAAKTDSGAKYMRPLVRTASTDYPGTSVGLAEAYGLQHHVWKQDPNTAADWLYTAINGMEIGQEVRDS